MEMNSNVVGFAVRMIAITIAVAVLFFMRRETQRPSEQKNVLCESNTMRKS